MKTMATRNSVSRAKQSDWRTGRLKLTGTADSGCMVRIPE